MDSVERALLREAITAAVERPDAQAALDALGWAELLLDEPKEGVSAVFEIQGARRANAAHLDDVFSAAAGLELDPSARWVLPFATPDPASSQTAGRLTVKGLVRDPEGAQRLIVPVQAEAGVSMLRVEDVSVSGEQLAIDPGSGWVHVSQSFPEPGTNTGVVAGEDAWRAALTAGHRATAHELVGTARGMISLTAEHVQTRIQFGRALGSFQAVKHKLADVYLWTEAAALAADAAWESQGPAEAMAGRQLACRASALARENCQQLLGGMGFTWEFDFHRYLRRALVLEYLLGTAQQLRTVLGRMLYDRDPRLEPSQL